MDFSYETLYFDLYILHALFLLYGSGKEIHQGIFGRYDAP